MKLKAKIVIYAILAGLILSMGIKINKYRNELKITKQNNHSLMVGVETSSLEKEKWIAKANTLQLSLSEYKQYRAEDLDSIKKLGAQIKNLRAVAKHHMEINKELSGKLKDTTVIRVVDSVETYVPLKVLEVDERPHLYLSGIIEDKKFDGTIKIPVTIRQYIEADYRCKFLWWRWGLKGFKQTVVSENPFVEIKYTEFIKIRK